VKSDDEKSKASLGPLTLEMVMRLGEQQKPKQNEQVDNFVELIAREKNIMQPELDMNSVKMADPSVFKLLTPTNLTMSQIKNMTNEELIKTLTGELNPKANRIADGSMQLISNELLTRQIKEASKPHWNVYAILALTLVAAAASVVALLK